MAKTIKTKKKSAAKTIKQIAKRPIKPAQKKAVKVKLIKKQIVVKPKIKLGKNLKITKPKIDTAIDTGRPTETIDPAIAQKIKNICQQLEKEKNIKILFAVENGSRAWRLSSKDSDYDVRFVFKRPLSEYIQLNMPIDVINVFYDKEGKPCSAENAFIDLSGFDVFKFARMLSASNPTTIEWLTSDIVYYGEDQGKQNAVFREFALRNFNKISLYHHYKSMCRSNYLKYLKSGSSVTYKKYLYAYRGLVNSKWVAHKQSVPPIIFSDAIKDMEGIIPSYILEKLRGIIALKSKGREKDIIQNIVEMDNYIEEFLKNDDEAPHQKGHATFNELNEELKRIVMS